MVNNPNYRNYVFLLNDVRLQQGEESAIRARYHNVEIANNVEKGHRPGGG